MKAFASDIYNDAERLDRAFVQMLELDRMEAGGTILKIAHADINQLITGVAAVARIANPKAVFTLSLDPSMPEVSCDRDRVSQVVTILISNAIKYSPAGSSIVVSSQVESANVKVTVKDEGPGMPPEFEGGLLVGYQPHVKGAVNGLNGRGHTGLGLPIARHIVEMHGGKIWFDSSAGRGSEFHFTLPLQVRPQRDVEVVALNT